MALLQLFILVSIFSVGLLIGAALTIVIPEGIDTIYSSSSFPPTHNQNFQHHHPSHSQEHHSAIGLALMGGFMLMFLIDQITRTPTLKNKSTSNSKRSFLQARRHSNSEVGKTAPSAQSAGLLAEESWQEDGLVEYEIDALLVMREEELEEGTRQAQEYHSFSTVIGLLTHSVADGIALGASSTHTTQEGGRKGGLSLALIIFLAIMVHKAPAAFGMVAVLLAEGMSPGTVRRILLAFSLAAPLGALITWAALALLDRLANKHSSLPAPDPEEGNQQAMQWWIGVTLLFSAGTFLFVATHALQNSSSQPIDPCCPKPPPNPPSHPHPHSSDHPIDPSVSSPVSVRPLLTCVLMTSGMCFPWLLTLIVGDHHH
ncbi:hypothetical protein VP01_2710g5 [Puccinia sorghi]|uniref:Uncharacterized protein n=1 Tax=Puccinia sorghi TaxID=27349 RepID=A0A0L6V5A9_9BASI|nr:hypothetical protein VP01_2710g5 [Puccinia sorghi]